MVEWGIDSFRRNWHARWNWVVGQVDMPAAETSAPAEYKPAGRGGDWVLVEVVVKSGQANIPAESETPIMLPANSHFTVRILFYC